MSGATGGKGAGRSLKVDGSVLEGISREPLPGSRKVYVPGVLHPDLRVPLREISQTPTRHHGQGEGTPNPPVYVYDASGPYGPRGAHRPARGLPALREGWVLARSDLRRSRA